jgi:RND family efflux transporter MFP subunit
LTAVSPLRGPAAVWPGTEAEQITSKSSLRVVMRVRRSVSRGGSCRMLSVSSKSLAAAGVIGVAAAACTWWLSRSQITAPASSAIPVRVVAVAQRDVPDVIRAIGTVRSHRSVIIRPQVDGELVELLVREGQQVKRGDLLARIDDRAIAAALEQARAQLAVSQAQLKAANLDQERYLRLQGEHVISRQILDQQQAQVDQLQATVRVNQAAIAAREVQLSHTRIHSAADGRVGIRNFDAGSFLRTSDAEGLFSIVQLDPISVEIALPQSMLPQLQQLMNDADGATPVHAFASDRGELLGEGHLTVIDNRVSLATGTILVKAEFANPRGELWPDQTVAVSVQLRMLRDVLVAPQTAVQRGLQGDVVYRVREDRAEIVPVQLTYADSQIAVLSGVEPGDQVVIDGQSRLRPGARVQIQEQPLAAENVP